MSGDRPNRPFLIDEGLSQSRFHAVEATLGLGYHPALRPNPPEHVSTAARGAELDSPSRGVPIDVHQMSHSKNLLAKDARQRLAQCVGHSDLLGAIERVGKCRFHQAPRRRAPNVGRHEARSVNPFPERHRAVPSLVTWGSSRDEERMSERARIEAHHSPTSDMTRERLSAKRYFKHDRHHDVNGLAGPGTNQFRPCLTSRDLYSTAAKWRRCLQAASRHRAVTADGLMAWSAVGERRAHANGSNRFSARCRMHAVGSDSNPG